MALSTLAVTPSLPPNSNLKTSSKKPTNSNSQKTQLLPLLKTCKSLTQFPQIHSLILKSGQTQSPHLLFVTLRLLSTLKSPHYASKLFATIEKPDIYHYTTLISTLTASGSYKEALNLYSQMLHRSVAPDPVIISSVLKLCGFLLALNEGKQIHNQVVKYGFALDRLVKMKLIELYGKCGRFEDALLVLDEMPKRDAVASTVLINSYSDCGRIDEAMAAFRAAFDKDTVCWTSIIDGCVRNGKYNLALDLFREMQKEKVRANEVTVVCVLSACAQLGALELGRWIESYINKYNITRNTFVCSALVDMYSKCGSLDEARKIFNEMKERDVISYNSMITGLSLHGKSSEAVQLYQELIREGLSPTHITFVGALNACSHGGLVDLGFEIFESMTKNYGLEPKVEHYGCIVDLLGRSGLLEEAYEFVSRMRIEPDHVIWGSLLGACRVHGNLSLAEKVAKIMTDDEKADSGTFVLLSNVYASLGKWKEAVRVRATMKHKGIQKEPGCSSIEVQNEIHEFLLGDIRHPRKEEIYKKLEDLNNVLKNEGYFPKRNEVLQDIEEGEKDWALAIHSERLAICYGLITTEKGTTIRVVKNLRVCRDCHEMIKIVSRVERRRIVVRDRNRFHHFEDGVCSCGGYW
ncbi:uncharacterized protein A4U43_C10F13780 [Asparagus officinalis]|uniref:DYW domain-containing protein n=1 Tax=Asparagus officinalis TaxID=4686 RepID=A0A5P1E4E8_ASPOF|nr:putative pentatricopeptide repeat-containing protein At5g59200, chloroplastic [Asparagus officinalis]ONK56853.1 uncharacterized protein A4U43_C10F13780 [Asparagus officinalis]